MSPSGKARDFDSLTRGFESRLPSQRPSGGGCDPLAQLAEHLTFNQGVRSSNLRWVTIIFRTSGEVSEWFKELVLKTSDPARDRGFESHSLRHLDLIEHLDRTFQWSCTQVGDEAPLLRA